MADKAVNELTQATQITATDLFVLEQNGEAKKLTGQTLENWLLEMADGRGGIQQIEKVTTSGLVDMYRITFSDTSTFTYTVTNGAKGDPGEKTYLWIKYSDQKPTSNADMYDTPDNWIGIYTGVASAAPAEYTQYTWFQIKGEKGDPGEPITLTGSTVSYQVSDSGTVVPSGTWLTNPPLVPQGRFLWTRVVLAFNSGSTTTFYSVARTGIDGTGSVVSVNNVSPDANGNVTLTPAALGLTRYYASAKGSAVSLSLPASQIVQLTLDTWNANSDNAFAFVDGGIVMPADGTVLVCAGVYFDSPSSAKPQDVGPYVHKNGVEVGGQTTYTRTIGVTSLSPFILEVATGDVLTLSARNRTVDGTCIPNAKATALVVIYL